MIRRRGAHDLVVIGGGIAGLTAAVHAARFGLHVALVEARGIYGGLVATIEHIDSILLSQSLSGQALSTSLVQSCVAVGVTLLEDEVTNVERGNPLKIVAASGKRYPARSVVVASGGRLRKLNVPGEDQFLGRGVSQCASCDGHFFKGTNVVVAGGGNAAAQEALILAAMCQKVTIVSRSRLRARHSYIEQLTSRRNVEFIWNATIAAISGGDRVTGVQIRNQQDGDVTDYPCSGVFPFIGVEPNAGFVPASLKDNAGYVVTNEALETEEKCIFAAGTVRRGNGGYLEQAAAEGMIAGQRAVSFLSA